MRESSTYQAFLREGEAVGEARGRASEARAILLRLGSRRFGPPDRRTRVAVQRLADLGRLGQLTDRVLNVGSWEDLLAKP